MAAKLAIKSTPFFTFDPARHTYVNASGHRLSQAEIRGFVDKAVQAARVEARGIAESYLAHRNSAEFETAMKALLKNEHLSLSMIANGGREQMTNALWGKTGAVIKSQYQYLEAFGRQIDEGSVSDAQLLARSELYANFGEQLYENMLRDGMIDAGMTEAMNVLGASYQSCSECPDLSAAGWMPIADMPEIGTRECAMGCHCSVNYR